MKVFVGAIALAAVAAVASTPAHAVQIADGNVSSAYLFSPTIDLTTDPSSYGVMTGSTLQVNATGGFAGAQGGSGALNGSITFSQSVGTTINETLDNLFVFSDGQGGSYNFSATSVLTRTFANNPGVTTSGSLYLLGTTVNTTLNYDPTPTSLTISFNSTGGSAYSSSATLAVPPEPTTVPEPASLALLGAGLLGLGIARRKIV